MEVVINTVYSFKTIGGEELVGNIIEINDDHYVVESPLSTAPTREGLQMMPTLFTTDLNPTVNIYKHTIGITATPREDVLDAYRESVTGIKVPAKKIILG